MLREGLEERAPNSGTVAPNGQLSSSLKHVGTMRMKLRKPLRRTAVKGKPCKSETLRSTWSASTSTRVPSTGHCSKGVDEAFVSVYIPYSYHVTALVRECAPTAVSTGNVFRLDTMYRNTATQTLTNCLKPTLFWLGRSPLRSTFGPDLQTREPVSRN